jgi:hypothetical protein
MALLVASTISDRSARSRSGRHETARLAKLACVVEREAGLFATTAVSADACAKTSVRSGRAKGELVLTAEQTVDRGPSGYGSTEAGCRGDCGQGEKPMHFGIVLSLWEIGFRGEGICC